MAWDYFLSIDKLFTTGDFVSSKYPVPQHVWLLENQVPWWFWYARNDEGSTMHMDDEPPLSGAWSFSVGYPLFAGSFSEALVGGELQLQPVCIADDGIAPMVFHVVFHIL